MELSQAPPTKKRSMSASCSPLFRRRKRERNLTACDPIESSSYQLANIQYTECQTVEMSPRTKRKAIWRSILPFVSPFQTRKYRPFDYAARVTPKSPREGLIIAENSVEKQQFLLTSLDSQQINFSLHYVTFLVKIRLKEGCGLAIRDASGSSDPYVKFKYKDRIIYKSNIVFKNLNPVWEEEFSLLVDDITSPIDIEVFDYDRFCTDDFMGSSHIDLSQLKLFQPRDLTLHLTSHGAPPGACGEDEDLGSLTLTVSIVPQTQEEKDQFLLKANRGVISASEVKAQRLVQVWSSIVNIILVEAKGLQSPLNPTGSPDPYCKFKLGQEKYKSKVCTRTTEPKWIEQFDLHIYEGGSEKLEISCNDKKTGTPIGRTALDLSSLERESTVQQWYTLYAAEDETPCGAVLLLITISGSQSTDTVVDLAEFNQNDVRHSIIHRFDTLHTLENMKEIGHLTVKVFRADNLQAADIGGKSDPFVVVELVNTRLQTHTEYKTLTPHWNKLLIFSIKDIHTTLEVTVYDEDPNNKFEFLGKVAIPLINIRNCEKKWYALKDKKLLTRAKGEILLEMDLIWNPIRAAIRTFNPREKKYMEQEQKFKASLFRSTVMELKDAALAIIEYKDYVNSCFDWESTPRSSVAFVLFMVTVYWVELHHLPLFLLLLFLKGYVYRRVVDGITNRRVEERSEKRGGDSDDEKDSSPSRGKVQEQTSSSLRDTLFSVQETLQVVQNVLLFICHLLQRIKNTFNFTNPWLSWLAVIVLSIVSIVLYTVPIRWLVMIWGVNKFTKKLRNPHYVDNNELLDYLSRIPSDTELTQWKELPVRPPADAKKTTVKQLSTKA